jgi:hypothetical protein
MSRKNSMQSTFDVAEALDERRDVGTSGLRSEERLVRGKAQVDVRPDTLLQELSAGLAAIEGH